jgi:hypothetical protein
VSGNKTPPAACDVALTTTTWMNGLAGLLLTVGCTSGSSGHPSGGTGGEEPEADAAPATGGATGTGGAPVSVDALAADLAVMPDAATGADRALMRDAAAPDAAADSSASPAAGGALNDYVFSVECPAGAMGGQCNVPDDRRLKTSMPVPFGGDPAVTYRVRLHFCGPVEGRKYAGCMKPTPADDPLFCMDGTPVPMSGGDQFVDTYPTYEMKVSAPAHSYFVNSRDLRDTLMKIDYTAELEIRGGATITFATTSREQITFTSRQVTPAITCPGVPGLTQPFNGQFIHVTVLSADPK